MLKYTNPVRNFCKQKLQPLPILFCVEQIVTEGKKSLLIRRKMDKLKKILLWRGLIKKLFLSPQNSLTNMEDKMKMPFHSHIVH